MESKYNYYIKQNDHFICLNGITGKIFKINQEGFIFFCNIISNEDLQKEYATITQKLYKDGFLVNNEFEEIEKLRNAYNEDKLNPIYHLVINPTLNCNFNCWYCYETHSKEIMTSETFEKIQKLIRYQLEKDEIEGIHLSWFGGEPLMCFKNIIYPLSLYAQEIALKMGKRYSSSMTTNGYLLTDDIIKLCYEINLNSLQVTIDGNSRTHDKIRNHNGKPSFDKIMSHCISFCSFSKSNKIILRVNYTDDSLCIDYDQLLDIIPKNIRSQINIDFQRVWQTYDKESESHEKHSMLQQNKRNIAHAGFNVSTGGFFNLHKGCVCYADRKNYAHINYDGNVYRCTARNYTKENSLGFIDNNGNIIWKKEIGNFSEKPFFENSKCLDCHYLALCGGPCFSEAMKFKSELCDCDLDNSDTLLEQYICDYYERLYNRKL